MNKYMTAGFQVHSPHPVVLSEGGMATLYFFV